MKNRQSKEKAGLIMRPVFFLVRPAGRTHFYGNGCVIRAILGIIGSLALALFIYGGFLWMTAAGNAEQLAKGKNTLIWATLGLIIIFSSYALVRFVIYEVIQAPGG